MTLEQLNARMINLLPEQELALAIILWRGLRSINHATTTPFETVVNNTPIGIQCIRMAKQCGVLNEFLELLEKTPLFCLTLVDIEEVACLPKASKNGSVTPSKSTKPSVLKKKAKRKRSGPYMRKPKPLVTSTPS